MVSLGKTLQSPNLVLVEPRKDMNNVSWCHDMTEILLQAVYNTIQSINKHETKWPLQWHISPLRLLL